MFSDDMYVVVERVVDGATVKYIELVSDRFTDETIPADSYFVDCGLSYDGAPANSFSGLDHLEGEDVAVLADGNVFNGLTVASGAVALPNSITASVVHIGLPYTSTMTTLDAELRGGNSPTIHNQIRNINGATIKLKDTRALWYGPDADNLDEYPFRTDEAPGDPTSLYTGEVDVALKPGSGETAEMTIVNTDPLPINVLSVITELEVGDQ